ncbi:hypothetical protein LEP1GSC036_4581 [Leptospira weilii str. 2006001853]|uniref:Uncharacterized protein n=2 Tax=Leptospira weilii TaxID=28184 RepID=A0A828Z258_9LEPT|nr:hypothetical protein LEP1GSC036_4581 [Leptospira weilii str. 2006001853]EMM71373.1 hypothetical protein LEP1GSC038_4128 [Leptospira weilii str. 2006001855]EMN44191.1 hypothetical protein LEP1GSC086_2949 [Leptospira weilii str. LNT 1234]
MQKNTARANISFLERVDFIRKLLEEISRITPIERKNKFSNLKSLRMFKKLR